MKSLFTILLLLLGGSSILWADIKVASLHPLITDLAHQVGGEHIQVVELMKPGSDPHKFEPTPGQLASLTNTRLILASGKGMETYLKKMSDNLAPGQEIFEVGKGVPSLKLDQKDELFICCPNHAHGGIDPHWWHSVRTMQRAASILSSEFSKVDPEQATAYKANAKAYIAKLKALDKWVKKEVSKIPRRQRKLCTAHLAFNYFCRDYGFKALPIQGLTREHNPSPAYLAESITEIRKQKIPAVFPERLSNPKVLHSMVKETNVKVGDALIADGSVKSYEAMIQNNVHAIVKALAPAR